MQQRSAFRRGGAAAGRGRGGRGRGRGGRGGKGPALSKDQLDAQLDNYNKKDRVRVTRNLKCNKVSLILKISRCCVT